MIDPEILQHYSLGLERDRLRQGVSSPIELVRTKELLARFLPPPPARILDVGGAAGTYSSWLANQEYDVHLIDPVPLHIEQAGEVSRMGEGFTTALGDARNLDQGDQSTDAVLLMGPIYHLVDRDDRLAALRESRRVTKHGGLVIVAAISRFASLLDGLASSSLGDSEFASIVDQDLATGVHRNPTGRPDWFTTAYFHRPDELAEEIEVSGLRLEALLGVEGPGWLTASEMDATTVSGEVLRAARALEDEPSVIGTSAHLLAVARS